MFDMYGIRLSFTPSTIRFMAEISVSLNFSFPVLFIGFLIFP